jgi:hypothetical protein
VAEFSIGVFLHVGLDLIPISFIIPNFLAISADGQQSLQSFDIVKSLLQLGDHPFAFFFCLLTLGYISGDALSSDKGTYPEFVM